MTERPPLNGLIEALVVDAYQRGWREGCETLIEDFPDALIAVPHKDAMGEGCGTFMMEASPQIEAMTNLNGDSDELVERVERWLEESKASCSTGGGVLVGISMKVDDIEGLIALARQASNHAELSERVRVLEADNALLRGLISEPSIEALAGDIAVACMDCRPDNVKLRHSAMVRLGKRLREPMEHDKARALLTDKGDVK